MDEGKNYTVTLLAFFLNFALIFFEDAQDNWENDVASNDGGVTSAENDAVSHDGGATTLENDAGSHDEGINAHNRYDLFLISKCLNSYYRQSTTARKSREELNAIEKQRYECIIVASLISAYISMYYYCNIQNKKNKC